MTFNDTVQAVYNSWAIITPLWDSHGLVMTKLDWLSHVLPFSAISLYLLMVWKGPELQKKRQFFSSEKGKKILKVILALWNLGLSVYSAFCCLFCITEVVHTLSVFDWNPYHLICDPTCYQYRGVSLLTFWGWSFALSKYVELGDTFWRIIKGKPNGVLHVWHHVSVLIATWYACAYSFGVGFVCILMNSFIHSFMYFYYFLTVLGYRPKWDFILTFAQTSQMVFGLVFTIIWCVGRYLGHGCCCTKVFILGSIFIVIYASYLYLFVDFAIGRYCKKKPAEKKETEAPAVSDVSEEGSDVSEEGLSFQTPGPKKKEGQN